MSDMTKYQHIGTHANVDYYVADPDIMLVIPGPGYRDTPELARLSANIMNDFARKAGKKMGHVIQMANVLSQDAETRRIYQNLAGNGLYFGVVLVVSNPMSRALASFFMGFVRLPVPMQVLDSVENGIEWLRTVRSQ